MVVEIPSYLWYPWHLQTADEKIQHLFVNLAYGFKSLARAAVRHSLDLLEEEG